VREQTLELSIDQCTKDKLNALSHSASLFYNAAFAQRQVSSTPINRTQQIKDAAHLYAVADIDPLPHSVARQLLLELDVVTYTPARSRKRSLDRFHALTWSSDDIEVDNNGILLQPNIRLLLPEFSDTSGILSRVRVRIIIKDVASVHFRWKTIPRTGPGKDRRRAFGYTSTVGAVENYIMGLGRLVR